MSGMLSLGGRIHKTCQICSLTTLILKFIIYTQYNIDKVYIISNQSKLSINLMSTATYAVVLLPNLIREGFGNAVFNAVFRKSKLRALKWHKPDLSIIISNQVMTF